MATPFKQESYVREVLLGTAAEWATWGDVLLESYQTARETDTGKEKTGAGLFADLPYDMPSGQIYDLTAGTPADGDQFEYNAVTPAVAATAVITCNDAGTVGRQIAVGDKVYEIVASGATGDQIDAGPNDSTYAGNIATKITDETANTFCTASLNGVDVELTANTAGEAGNSINLFSTDDSAEVTQEFEGGADQINVLKRTSAASVSSAPAFEVLTANDDDEVLWSFDGAESRNASLNLDGNYTLILDGIADGATGTIAITQDGGSNTLDLNGSDNYVVNDGAGVLTLTPTDGATDIASFVYDGGTDRIYWTLGNNFTAS